MLESHVIDTTELDSPITTAGERCFVAGIRSHAPVSDAIVFGDFLQATEDNQLLVGETIMGRQIPQHVRDNAETTRFILTTLRDIFTNQLGGSE